MDAADTEESQRCDKAPAEKLQVGEEKVTYQSRNASNHLTASGVARSDSSKNDNQQRSRLTARVSVDSVSGDTTCTSGTGGNVDNKRVLPRHHQKRSTLTDHREANEVDRGAEDVQTEKAMSSGQLIKSVWDNVDEDIRTSKSTRKQKRSRNKNVNASTQTTSVHDDLQTFGDLSSHSQGDRRVDEDAGKQEADSKTLADMLRLLAAPILASEVKTALVENRQSSGKLSSPDVTHGRSDPSHHNHHHHHHHHHLQQAEYRGPWNQTAEVMARRPAVKITSYDMSPAVRRLSPERESAAPVDGCPYCTRLQRPRSSNESAGKTQRSTDEERTGLDQLLTEISRNCDRSETASQLKAKLKRAIVDKYFHK